MCLPVISSLYAKNYMYHRNIKENIITQKPYAFQQHGNRNAPFSRKQQHHKTKIIYVSATAKFTQHSSRKYRRSLFAS